MAYRPSERGRSVTLMLLLASCAAQPASDPATTTTTTTTSTVTALASTTSSSSTTTLPPPAWAAKLRDQVATELQPLIAASAVIELLPSDITPPLANQADDATQILADGCLLGLQDVERPGRCSYGDLNSSFVVTIFGDSHVAQWFPGLVSAAAEQHWRLDVETKAICPAVDVPVMMNDQAGYPQCSDWYTKALARIAGSDTDLVVLTEWRWRYDRDDNGIRRPMRDSEWRAGLEHTAETLIAAGKHVLLLGDAPMPRMQMDECLAAYAHHVTRCSVNPARAINHAENALEQQIADAHPGAMFYDPRAWFCTDTTCPGVIGNMAVFLDPNHINATYSRFLAPYLTLLVKSAAGVAPE